MPEKSAGGRCEGDTIARAHPWQLDPGSFVHGHGRSAWVSEDDLSAFHLRWDFHVVGGREEASGMTVEHVVIAGPVHVNPAIQVEVVCLLALLRTEVIE